MLRKPKETKESDAKQVTDLLHTLRGEQFRHAQNLQRSTAHLSRASAYHSELNNPSLPFSQIFHAASRSGDHDAHPAPRPQERPRIIVENGIRQYAHPRGGPPEPKSWSAKGNGKDTADIDERDTPAWRRAALALVLEWPHASQPAVPPLADLCLRVLRSLHPGPDFAIVAQILPAHLRAALARWAAVHAPLPGPALALLCAPEGRADGEIVVVGPHAALRDVFRGDGSQGDSIDEDEDGLAPGTPAAPSASSSADLDQTAEAGAWDDPSAPDVASASLHTLALVRSALPVQLLFALPPTLTRLALVALPAPAPVHRLPRLVPLLEVLDLSYNPWLARPTPLAGAAERVLERVEWRRWGRLRVLGLRECGVGAEVVRRVNEGRWTDVEVVDLEMNEKKDGVFTSPSVSRTGLVDAVNDMRLET
ncbi:hypothetical protein CERSUDRAFT_122805 [Gelatoporia subvermispora B]|uniref:Uncharacterized protein n=1 Tax=Ceriporiopsis subvermispora (strain B) TaxID=914234 RepID=M2QLS3_CERS8|nr:hypothetical protein CERSUDRAFT_122805 [Gelatoporia subvermispora B]